MSAHAARAEHSKVPAAATRAATPQSSALNTPAFADNRPAAVAQRRQQGAINQSPQMQQAAALQARIAQGPRQQAATGAAPVQRKANQTGLPAALKAGVENLSGYSMDDVKVHYNSAKPADLQAHAYAQGTDIHVAPGQEEHLPHEAWHVVQQKQGRVRPTLQLKGKVTVNDDAGLEREADVMGEKALQAPAGSGEALTQRALPIGAVVQGVFRRMPGPPHGSIAYQDDKTAEIMSWQKSYPNGTTFLQNGHFNVIIDAAGNELSRTPIGADVATDDNMESGGEEELASSEPTNDEPVLTGSSGSEEGAVLYPPDHVHAAMRVLDMQASKLTTDLTAQIAVIPTQEGTFGQSDGVIEPRYGSEQLHILEIAIGDKDRPETRFDKQESHTVSWTLLRHGIMGLANRSLSSLLNYLLGAFEELSALVATREGELMLAHARDVLAAMRAARLPVDVWQRQASRLLVQYLQVYQMSRSATYRRGKALGHGEFYAMQHLHADEEALRNGEDARRLGAIQVDAAKLLDVQFRLDALGVSEYAAAVAHWIEMLQFAFPRLMKEHGKSITDPVLNKQLAPSFKAAFGKGKKEPMSVRELLAAEDRKVGKAEVPTPLALVPEELGDDGVDLGELASNFTANITLTPVVTGTGTMRPITSTTSIRDMTYRAGQLLISSVMVSDVDRPKTKFLSHQRSHLVPWTLTRAFIKKFAGQPAIQLLEYLAQLFQILRPNIEHPDGQAIADEGLTQLRAIVNEPHFLDQWQRHVSEVVRLYFIAYQVAESTSYINTSELDRAQGHGEGPNMLVLRRNEHMLIDNRIGDKPDRIQAAITGLFDAKYNDSLSESDIKQAYAGLKRKLQFIFPRIEKRYGPAAFAFLEAQPLGKKGRSLGEIVRDDKVAGPAVGTSLGYVEPAGPDHYTFPPDSLVDAQGDIRPERLPALVRAYRQDLAQTRAFLTEGEGQLVARRLRLNVRIYQGGVPPGFRLVENPGGGDCLLHALVQIWHRANGRPAVPANEQQIQELRQMLEARMSDDDIGLLVTAAVAGAIAGMPEPGLGSGMLRELADPSIAAARWRQHNPSSSSSSSSSAPKSPVSSAPKATPKPQPDQPQAPVAMATIGTGALLDNFVLVHVGLHYVMAERISG